MSWPDSLLLSTRLHFLYELLDAEINIHGLLHALLPRVPLPRLFFPLWFITTLWSWSYRWTRIRIRIGSVGNWVRKLMFAAWQLTADCCSWPQFIFRWEFWYPCSNSHWHMKIISLWNCFGVTAPKYLALAARNWYFADYSCLGIDAIVVWFRNYLQVVLLLSLLRACIRVFGYFVCSTNFCTGSS